MILVRLQLDGPLHGGADARVHVREEVAVCEQEGAQQQLPRGSKAGRAVESRAAPAALLQSIVLRADVSPLSSWQSCGD